MLCWRIWRYDFMKILHSRAERPQAGFGLIEIMISLALGVIIMLGVTQVATNNSETRYELERSARQIENAAYALREMESDITNAGFWGEMGVQPVVTSPPLSPPFPVCPDEACDRATDDDLSSTSCELNRAMGFPVQGGSASIRLRHTGYHHTQSRDGLSRHQARE